MPDLKKPLAELMHKEMTRKQFLGLVGITVLGIVGVLPAIESLTRKAKPKQPDLSFGSGNFGSREMTPQEHAWHKMKNDLAANPSKKVIDSVRS